MLKAYCTRDSESPFAVQPDFAPPKLLMKIQFRLFGCMVPRSFVPWPCSRRKAILKYLLTCTRNWLQPAIREAEFGLKAFLIAGFLLALCTFSAAAEGTPSGCSSLAQGNYPKASISNGQVQAVLYLPDAKNGYYRASRFDWSGVIPCLAYKGHTYFGIWFSHYDPLVADAIAGPVEEFRSSDGALDYDQAKPGGLFVKLGVGVLRKNDDSPYQFMYTYPLVNGGKWTVHAGHRQVSFRQQLHSPIGIAYDYEKTVSLDPHEPVLTLEHSLKNTGTKTIDTEVYDHDFFMLDGAPSGPGMVVRFPFAPKAEKSMEPRAASTVSNRLSGGAATGAVRGKLSDGLFR